MVHNTIDIVFFFKEKSEKITDNSLYVRQIRILVFWFLIHTLAPYSIRY